MEAVHTYVSSDLHTHLAFIEYTKSPDLVVDLARKRLGKGGIIGLVNFQDRRYEKFTESPGYERINIGNAVYFPQQDILVIKGEEISTDKGHLLVLATSYGKHPKPGRSLDDTIKEAKDDNGIIIADHPFYLQGLGPFLKRNQEYLEKIDALEVYNGEAELYIPGLTPGHANKKAYEFFNSVKSVYELGGILTSDGHSLFELAKAYTDIRKPSILNQETLTNSLRAGIKNCSRLIATGETSPKIGKFGAAKHLLELAVLLSIRKVLPNFKNSKSQKP